MPATLYRINAILRQAALAPTVLLVQTTCLYRANPVREARHARMDRSGSVRPHAWEFDEIQRDGAAIPSSSAALPVRVRAASPSRGRVLRRHEVQGLHRLDQPGLGIALGCGHDLEELRIGVRCGESLVARAP